MRGLASGLILLAAAGLGPGQEPPPEGPASRVSRPQEPQEEALGRLPPPPPGAEDRSAGDAEAWARSGDLAAADKAARERLADNTPPPSWHNPVMLGTVAVAALAVLVVGMVWWHRRRHMV